MNLRRRFTHGLFWSLLGITGARFFSLAATAAIARLLGKDAFGALGIIQSTLGFLGVFACFGLGPTATRYVAELRNRDRERCGHLIALCQLAALITGGTLTLVLFLAAPWLAWQTLKAPNLGFALQLSAPLLLIAAFLGVQTGCLSGFQAFRALARISIWQGAAALPLAVILVFCAGLSGAVLSLVFAALLGVFLSSQALIRECRAFGITTFYRRCWTEHHAFWRFSLPAVLAGSLYSPVTWAAQAILVRQPAGYSEMGLFYAASKLQVLLMFASHAVGLVTGPLLAEIYGSRDPRFFARAINVNLTASWTLALPAGFLLIGAGPWLMALFGPAFREGRLVPAILVCVAVLNLAHEALNQALVSSGRMWAGCTIHLGFALTLLTTAWILVPARGALGLALAYFLAYACQTLGALLYTGFRWGPESVAASGGLAALTGLMFLFSLIIDRFADGTLMLFSVLFAFVSLAWSWRLLPADGRRQLLALAGLGG
jgi:O-antigen/teichoic acid export membrane protein